MRQGSYFFIVWMLTALLISSCAKKELPSPYNDLSVTERLSPTSLKAPCDSILVNGIIKSSPNFQGYTTFNVGYSTYLYDHFDHIEIFCSDYSSSNDFSITLPVKYGFTGKIKYTLGSYWGGTNAEFYHSYGSYTTYYYDATSGYVYAEYTGSQLILTFCDVPVNDSGGYSLHYLSGKVTVAI